MDFLDLPELIELIKETLVRQANPSIIDVFINKGVPIIQLVILSCSAIAGVYKYYTSKNKEIYEKILAEVYAPLYQYFVKQELFCFINSFSRKIEESPILEFKSTIFKQTTEFQSQGIKTDNSNTSEYVLGLRRDEFVKILNTVNIGLASKELYTMLNMYKVLVYLEEKSAKDSDTFIKSTLMKVDVENSIRKDVIKGYLLYHKKLGIESITTTKFFSNEDDEIRFFYEVDTERSQRLRKDIEDNPDNNI